MSIKSGLTDTSLGISSRVNLIRWAFADFLSWHHWINETLNTFRFLCVTFPFAYLGV